MINQSDTRHHKLSEKIQ